VAIVFVSVGGRAAAGADLITSAPATGAPVDANGEIAVAISARPSVSITVLVFFKVLHLAMCRITVRGVSANVVRTVFVVATLPLLGKGWVIHKPTVGTGYLGPGGGG